MKTCSKTVQVYAMTLNPEVDHFRQKRPGNKTQWNVDRYKKCSKRPKITFQLHFNKKSPIQLTKESSKLKVKNK